MTELQAKIERQGLIARFGSAWRWLMTAGNDTFPTEETMRFDPRSHGVAAAFCAKWGYLAVAAVFIHALTLSLYGDVQKWIPYAIFGALAIAICLAAANKFADLKRWLERTPIGFILLLALAIRIAWIVLSDATQTSDFMYYDKAAVLIARGCRWINPAWPTGAPVLYASIYSIFGHHPMISQIVCGLLSVLQIFFVFDISRRTLHSSLAGKLAAVAMTFWPEHFLYTNLTGTEVPFATLVLAAVWILGVERGRYVSKVFLAGFLLGLANWVRPNAPIVLAAVVLYVVLRKAADEGWFARLKIASAAVAAFTAISLPIVWFNYYHLGIFSATASQKSGFNLMFGTNLDWGGQWNVSDEKALQKEFSRRTFPKVDDETEMMYRNRVAGEIGRWRLRTVPLQIVDMALRCKISTLWATPACLIWSFEKSRVTEWYDMAHYSSVLYHLTMVVLACWAVFRQRSVFMKFDERWIFVAMTLLATAFHLIFEVQPRYHNAYLPIFAFCIAGFARSFECAAGKIVPFARGEALERLFADKRKAA